jgi:hypothetical protein
MSAHLCSVCVHPEAGAISAALEAGARQLVIAAQFNVSKFALSRHKNRCMAPAAPDGESARTQLDRWLARADEIFLKASVDGNLAAQVSALSAALRGLQSAQKQEEKRQEQNGVGLLPNGETPVTVEELDRMVEKFCTSSQSGLCPCCGAPVMQGRFVALEPELRECQ